MLKIITLTLCLLATLSGCVSSQQQSLYEEIGGHEVIEQFVDNFIMEIANDPRVLPRFLDSNVDRFRQKMIEHICFLADGPCLYTGDSMVQVHAGMNISSAEFNAIVENTMRAMEQTGIAISTQNQILARLAPLRPEIIGI